MSADLRAQAVEHVEHARRDYPELRDVDPEVFIGIVESYLRPLNPDRPWTHRRWQAGRGSASWVGGRVGLHVPRQRQEAA